MQFPAQYLCHRILWCYLFKNIIILFSYIPVARLKEVDTNKPQKVRNFRNMKLLSLRIKQFEVKLVLKYFGYFVIIALDTIQFSVV